MFQRVLLLSIVEKDRKLKKKNQKQGDACYFGKT